MRRSYLVTVDGNSPARTRYFIEGSEVTPDAYIAEFFKDYGSVPTDTNITLTVRQEADNAGQTTEDGAASGANLQDFAAIEAADAANPGGITGISDVTLS